VGYPKRVGGVHFIEVSGRPKPVLPALLLRRLEDKFENMGAQMVREVADNRSPVYLNKDLPGPLAGEVSQQSNCISRAKFIRLQKLIPYKAYLPRTASFKPPTALRTFPFT
jgi:hypothetical protein